MDPARVGFRVERVPRQHHAKLITIRELADAIASERLEEIRQMCERIYDLEQDRQRLQMLIAHLADEQVFELTSDELVSYGFRPDAAP